MPPALLALDALVILRRGAARREVPLSSFFLGYRKTALQPGEFLELIRIPRPMPGTVFATYKVSKRIDQDISAVCGAFAVELSGGRVHSARVAYGGMAATPLRVASAEAALAGKPFGEAAIEAAAGAVDTALSPITDMRASAAYRKLVAGNLLRRFWLEASGVPGRAPAPTAEEAR